MPTPIVPSSSRPLDPMVARTRTTQFLIIIGLLILSTSTARSGGLGGLGSLGGGGMPWEGPLNQLLDSLTGPVSRVVGAVAIVGLGVGIAFSEGGSMMRKALWVSFLVASPSCSTRGISFLSSSAPRPP